MKKKSAISDLLQRFHKLSFLRHELEEATAALVEAYWNNQKILICGNGGSSADADHMVGELMKSFEQMRPLGSELKNNLIQVSADKGKYLAENLQQGIPAFSLSSNPALVSAILNDMGSDLVFAQQVISVGNPGDILIGFSTSGNSENIVNAMIAAKAKKLKTIGLTGKTGGAIKQFSDILLNVPETETAAIQELHLPVYHAICRQLELEVFDVGE